jgi:hypothetical protein
MKAAGAGRAEKAWRWILIGGAALILALNLPGHLPYDSVNALWQGRTHIRIDWGPRMYDALLGAFDAIAPGTGLFLTASVLVLFGAWTALPRLRPQVSWAGPVLLVAWLTHPEVLIFQGVIWRDVLFANLLVAGFVALAVAAYRWSSPAPRLGLLALAAVCLALASLVRQNGGVAILPAAVVLGWTALREGWRRALAWGAAGLVTPLLLMAVLSGLNPVHTAPDGPQKLDIGPWLLAQYDVVGALAEDPARPMPVLAAANPAGLALLRSQAPKSYSPVRNDTMNGDRALQLGLWMMSEPVTRQAWLQLIASDPGGYLHRRWTVFRWVFAPPDLALCVPIHLGVSGRPDILAKLRLREEHWPQDGRLYAYASRWFATPLYSHLTFAGLAVGVAVLLLIRRDPADVVMAGLMAAALAFTGSFFVLSIACDYRYLYALDLAAITGTLYFALDPRLARGRRLETDR